MLSAGSCSAYRVRVGFEGLARGKDDQRNGTGPTPLPVLVILGIGLGAVVGGM
jgi:hypothetical protein